MQKGGAGLRHQPLSTFWDRWAQLYDLTQWTNRRANAAAAARTAERIPAGARVLDCAAGTGLFSLAAAERAGFVLCTDPPYPSTFQVRGTETFVTEALTLVQPDFKRKRKIDS